MLEAINTKISAEVQNLAPSAIIDLYELDTTELIDKEGSYGNIARFHTGTNGVQSMIVWQGESYIPFPIEVTGFEYTSKGTIPRPIVKIANINGTISSILYAFDNLIGAKVVRKRTFAKFLDAVNFPGGVNPDADPNADFPDEVYYVSRKANENHLIVELELSPLWDLHGIKLPRRQCSQNVCPWKYKGLECGYWMTPVFTKPALAYTVVAVSSNTNNSAGTTIGDMTITSTGHPLVAGDAVYVEFQDDNIAMSGVYTVVSKTNDTFVVHPGVFLGSSTSGFVNVTNRYSLADQPIFEASLVDANDRCSKKLNSCKLRYGNDMVVPYGGFPGVGWIR